MFSKWAHGLTNGWLRIIWSSSCFMMPGTFIALILSSAYSNIMSLSKVKASISAGSAAFLCDGEKLVGSWGFLEELLWFFWSLEDRLWDDAAPCNTCHFQNSRKWATTCQIWVLVWLWLEGLTYTSSVVLVMIMSWCQIHFKFHIKCVVPNVYSGVFVKYQSGRNSV